MVFRAAFLTDPRDVLNASLWNALGACSCEVEMLVLGHGAADAPPSGSAARFFGQTRISRLTYSRPVQILAQLSLFRPQLIVCENLGWQTLQAALFRAMSARARLLLCMTEAPSVLAPRSRWILRNTDGVLVDSAQVAATVEALQFPTARIFSSSQSHDLEAFLACRALRSDAEARRLIFAGDLTPGSGAADLLINVVSWAEENPEQPIEIWWAGDGDLVGVLDAQPLPTSVSQRFLGRLETSDLAAVFTQCGILVVPSLGNDRRAPVLEGLAAGLPVLGSQLSSRVLHSVRDDVNGWLFDPLQPNGMADALDRAMTVPLATLEQMRDRAQATVRPAATLGLAERFALPLTTIMPDAFRAPASQSAR